MNINELSQYGEYTRPLVQLYETVGNRSIDGYLGENLEDVVFDGEGKLHFSTHKEVEETSIDSHGVILSDGVLIEQTQKGRSFTSHRLYSWDTENNQYTYLAFDHLFAMKRFYDVIQRFDAVLCGDDISQQFQEMGLSFENVTQILLNQKVSPLDRMFEEEEKESGTGMKM